MTKSLDNLYERLEFYNIKERDIAIHSPIGFAITMGFVLDSYDRLARGIGSSEREQNILIMDLYKRIVQAMSMVILSENGGGFAKLLFLESDFIESAIMEGAKTARDIYGRTDEYRFLQKIYCEREEEYNV